MSENKAALTSRELERWLALAVGTYHSSVHGNLLQPPAARWAAAVEPVSVPTVATRVTAFLVDFLLVANGGAIPGQCGGVKAGQSGRGRGRSRSALFDSALAGERELIRERTKAGMAAAKRRGVKVGRPAKLSGFQLEQAREMIEAGKSRADVAALLGVNVATLRRALNGAA